MRTTLRASSALVLAGLVTSGYAGTIGLAGGFNAFLFSDVSAGSGESDGALAVGGNWTTGSNYQVNTHGSTPNPTLGSATNLGLYVNGSLYSGQNGGSLHINSGRNAYIGGAKTGSSMNLNGGGSLFTNSAAVSSSIFADQFAYSTQQSNYLATLAGTAVNTSNSNNYHATISKVGGLNVFTIDASKLGANATLDVQGGTGQETIVFNVLNGSNVNWSTSYNGDKSKTLWNFGNAQALNVTGRALQGSVLATGATVNQSQNIEGTLIANRLNVSGGAELHSYSFQGCAPVPEPGTMAVLGMGGLAAMLRRRKARKA